MPLKPNDDQQRAESRPALLQRQDEKPPRREESTARSKAARGAVLPAGHDPARL